LSFSAALVSVALVSRRWPRLAGLILVLPNSLAGIILVPFALDVGGAAAGILILFLLFFAIPFAAGLLFFLARRRMALDKPGDGSATSVLGLL
jgi:hypothetical protein